MMIKIRYKKPIVSKQRKKKKNIKLDIERMPGRGPANHQNFQVNYLFGLNDLCKKYLSKDKIVLELGSNEGVSTSLFSFYCKKVVAVDRIKKTQIEKIVLKNKNIEFHHMNFYDFAKIYTSRKYDLVYIDGDHEFQSVSKDIRTFLPKIKKDGYISGHDFWIKGVEDAVNLIFPKRKIEIFSDSSWLIKI